MALPGPIDVLVNLIVGIVVAVVIFILGLIPTPPGAAANSSFLGRLKSAWNNALYPALFSGVTAGLAFFTQGSDLTTPDLLVTAATAGATAFLTRFDATTNSPRYLQQRK